MRLLHTHKCQRIFNEMYPFPPNFPFIRFLGSVYCVVRIKQLFNKNIWNRHLAFSNFFLFMPSSTKKGLTFVGCRYYYNNNNNNKFFHRLPHWNANFDWNWISMSRLISSPFFFTSKNFVLWHGLWIKSHEKMAHKHRHDM